MKKVERSVQEFTISNLEAGQRLDKYLFKLLPNAGRNFIYKMLRKKNITFNDKKADGNEKIGQGDLVKIYFADETFEKFAGKNKLNDGYDSQDIYISNQISNKKVLPKLDIVYENEDYLLVNKPVGLLSQKADLKDIALVDMIGEYLAQKDNLTQKDGQQFSTFKAGICNRLDRNTSGIVAAGKSMYGLQKLSEGFRLRTYLKYYITVVKGVIDKRALITGYLSKDESINKVHIISEQEYRQCSNKEQYAAIQTEYIPVCSSACLTLLKVHLLTGKSHQIRAHLAYIKHPIAGDVKYGDNDFNQYVFHQYGIKSQMLHAYELHIPKKSDNKLTQDIIAKTQIPDVFIKVLKGEKIWEHGIQEVLEALH